MFKTQNGIDLINDTLGQFEKVKIQLKSGIEKCQGVITDNEEKVVQLNNETFKNVQVMQKAEKAINNINKLIGENNNG